MVGYVQPVSDILTVSVYRKLFVCQCAADHKRNQLLREVIRAVVVGASGNGNRGTEGSVVSQYKQVCACFGCRVRAGGVDRGILCKEQVRAIQRKVSVNFIGRYLMISLYAEFSGSIQQYTGSHYVGLNKDARILDGTVYMALCCEIDNNVKFLFFKQIHDESFVCDITFYKFVVRFVLNRFQSLQVSRIGQQVQVYDLIIRVFVYHVMYEVSADKSSSACY